MRSSVAFITGASSGIGWALAEEFQRKGYRVSLFARRKERLEDFASRASSTKSSVLACPGDVTCEDDLRRAVSATIEHFGRIDVVIANAGIAVTGAFLSLNADDFKRQFSTNVEGVLTTCRLTLPELQKTRGSLAIVGSVSGYASVAGDSPYSMSKAAVRALADTLYLEQKKCGVHVMHVCPGFIDSEIRLKNNWGNLVEGAKDYVPWIVVMPTARAAKKIVSAIERRKRELVLTALGKFAVFVRLKLSWLYFFLTARIPSR